MKIVMKRRMKKRRPTVRKRIDRHCRLCRCLCSEFAVVYRGVAIEELPPSENMWFGGDPKCVLL